MPRTFSRAGFECARDLADYRNAHPEIFPILEHGPELRRGDQRLAIEVALAEFRGQDVPSFAHERAFETLLVMAKG